MTGLVLQLQADAMDSSTRVTDLLRKAKTVAIKFNLRDVAGWIEQELDGYSKESDTPEYRNIHGTIKFLNLHRGWQPVIFNDDEFESSVTKFNIRQSLGSLENIAYRSKGNAGFLAYPLPGESQHILARSVGIEAEFQMHFDVSQAFGIFDAIRNRVLDWALDLEKRGIVGEGMSFNAREQETAKALSSGNIYHIQNVGVLGDVVRSHVTNNQSADFARRELIELKSVIHQILNAAHNLDDGIQKEISALSRQVLGEIDQEKPESSQVRSFLRSIKTVCEGASGNLIATGVLGLISKFI